MICEHRLGLISANAAVDESNTGGADEVILLPRIRMPARKSSATRCKRRFGVRLGLVITDTFGRPWRLGQVNVAIGLAGVPARIDEAVEPTRAGGPCG
jgi:coenzyme F420-0:L-glutamate ligase/coenzyme F420-1:gamma-L-glutamate ligase